MMHVEIMGNGTTYLECVSEVDVFRLLESEGDHRHVGHSTEMRRQSSVSGWKGV